VEKKKVVQCSLKLDLEETFINVVSRYNEVRLTSERDHSNTNSGLNSSRQIYFVRVLLLEQNGLREFELVKPLQPLWQNIAM
jgi:hypothetical protein